MIVVPESSAVSARFSEAAWHYEKWAFHQRRVAADLCKILGPDFPGSSMLELGCGTGILTELLRKTKPEAEITAIDIAPGMIEYCMRERRIGGITHFAVAPAENWRSDRAYDSVISSCSFQWFSNRRLVIENCARQLVAKGTLAFAVPIEGTLFELDRSYQRATGLRRHRLNWWNENHYIDLCRQAGFELKAVRTEPVTVLYEDPLFAIKALKAIGAAFQPAASITLSFSQLSRIRRIYRDEFGRPGGKVPVTYRVLYVLARSR